MSKYNYLETMKEDVKEWLASEVCVERVLTGAEYKRSKVLAVHYGDTWELPDWREKTCGEEWEGDPVTAEDWAAIESALEEHAAAAAMRAAELVTDEFGMVGVVVDLSENFVF